MVNIEVNNKTIPNIKLLIFDKDGTLIDLYVYWSGMLTLRSNIICERLGIPFEPHKINLLEVMGIDTLQEQIKPEGPVGLLPRKVVQKAAEDYLSSIGQKEVEKVCFDSFAEADKLSLEKLDALIKPIDGLFNMVNTLIENNCYLAIATTDKKERAELCLDTLGLKKDFTFIFGADQVNKSKPDPEMIHLILEQSKVSPQNAVMVGDALTDVAMGINAGLAASIGVCTGLTSKEKLMEHIEFYADDISMLKFTPANIK